MKSIEELKKTKNKAAKALLSRPGVMMVGIGYKEVSGKETDEPSIRVYLKRKRSDIASHRQIPSKIDDVKTDIIEIGNRGAAYGTRIGARNRANINAQLIGGVEVGPARLIGNQRNRGTLGAIVVDNEGNPMLLSSYHVLAVNDDWQIGSNNRISQPAAVQNNTVALLRYAILQGNVDAAVAAITDNSRHLVKCGVMGIGQIIGSASREEVEQMWRNRDLRVRKTGFRTRLREGHISDIDLEGSIEYRLSNHTHYFENQIGITPASSFSAGGDSGSCIVDDSNRAIGLLVGAIGNVTVANYFRDVETLLGVQVCTEGT